MKIIDKILEIISRIFKKGPKMIEAPKNDGKLENIEMIIDEKISNKNISKEEAITQILKEIGCEKEIFPKLDISNIDSLNFRKNIEFLLKFKYSEFELAKIFTQNPKIFKIQFEDLENRVKELRQVTDYQTIKKIIFNNPYVLTNELNLNELIDVLEKYEIDSKSQAMIFKYNSNIFNLSAEKLENSLDKIYNIIENKKELKKVIISEPILVGIENGIMISNILNG